MKRIVEPELMNEEKQSLAYAQADFEEPHNSFIQLFKKKFGNNIGTQVLDLGCGTGDITLRFAKAYSNCCIHGIDGAKTMLSHAYQNLANCPEDIITRVTFIEGILPQTSLPLEHYEVIISNSLHHHLHDPLVLWKLIENYAQKGTKIFVMDLLRPDTIEKAKELVENYAKNEPEILQRDFFNSLCAAFTLSEIKQQLNSVNLDYLSVEKISDRAAPFHDRHFIVYGEY